MHLALELSKTIPRVAMKTVAGTSVAHGFKCSHHRDRVVLIQMSVAKPVG